jgi:hypothetical protein
MPQDLYFGHVLGHLYFHAQLGLRMCFGKVHHFHLLIYLPLGLL